jgi:hypothetical protein
MEELIRHQQQQLTCSLFVSKLCPL